LLIFNTALLS